MKKTKEKYCIDGIYTEKRRELHESIIANVLEGTIQDRELPDSFLLGGGSAVGKSTISDLFIKGYIAQEKDLVIIDCDQIKEMLPEYRMMTKSKVKARIEQAAFQVHDESSDIADEIVDICIREKRNFLYDGTMKNKEKYKRIVKQLKDASFNITGIIVDVSLEIALRRAQIRFDAEHRAVPKHIIKESHLNVVETFNEIKDDLDNYLMWDNTKENPEPDPYIFARKSSGVEEILFPERLEQFNSKSSSITIEEG